MEIRVDLTGKRFGHLTVICRSGSKNNRTLWECRCDCGVTAFVDTHSLSTGNTKSCGCQKHRGRTIHGQAAGNQTRLYRIWAAMKKRCKNPSNTNYDHYGGRGIRVCGDWNDFIPFRDWALANGYTDSLTIDRIDPNGNYEPKNCRWVTYAVQENNTTRNHYVEAYGKRMTVSQWACETGFPYKTLVTRLNLLGWSGEAAVTIPIGRRLFVG